MINNDEKIDLNHVHFCKGLRHLINESRGELTQKSICEKAHVSAVNMSRVLNSTHGTTPRWRTVVAEAAGSTAKDLISAGLSLSDKGIMERRPDGSREDQAGGVPLLTWNQARNWPEATEVRAWVQTPAGHSPRTFALKIKDDSMEPEFQAGDTIIVDSNVKPISGKFVIIKTLKGENGEATIGQLIRNDASTVLAPTNRRYPIIDLSGIFFEIIGTVIYKQKSYTDEEI